jgi:hypothetical protein
VARLENSETASRSPSLGFDLGGISLLKHSTDHFAVITKLQFQLLSRQEKPSGRMK